MMLTMQERLPNWSATVDPTAIFDASAFARAAAEFVRQSPGEREDFVATYSARFCDPDLSIAEASGLYVMLRTAFDLPSNLTRGRAKSFGGWIHPSVGTGTATFDLSWPVRIQNGSLTIDPCMGYIGGPWSAIDEYRYFAENFPLRPAATLDALAGGAGPPIA